MMDFWSLIAQTTDYRDAIAGWRFYFGREFESVRPYLIACPGECCSTYPDPTSGRRLQLTHYQGRWAAYREDDDCAEDLILKETDVQLYRLDLRLLNDHIRQSVGMSSASGSPSSLLHRLGNCPKGPKPRKAYVMYSIEEAEVMIGAQGMSSRIDSDSCLFLPTLFDSVQSMLSEKGISAVQLSDNYSLSDGKVSGDCGIVCKGCSEYGIRKLHSQIDTRSDRLEGKLDRVGQHMVDLEAENQLLKQQFVKALVEISKRVESEYFVWILTILGKGSVSSAAVKLEMSNSTFDERLKKKSEESRLNKTLYDLVAVRRKGIGQKPILEFDALFKGLKQPRSLDLEDFLNQLLSRLEALNKKKFNPALVELMELVENQYPEENPETYNSFHRIE